MTHLFLNHLYSVCLSRILVTSLFIFTLVHLSPSSCLFFSLLTLIPFCLMKEEKTSSIHPSSSSSRTNSTTLYSLLSLSSLTRGISFVMFTWFNEQKFDTMKRKQDSCSLFFHVDQVKNVPYTRKDISSDDERERRTKNCLFFLCFFFLSKMHARQETLTHSDR